MLKRLAIAIILALLCAPALGGRAAAEIATFDQGSLNQLLRESQGKVVMLNFFATWCPPCVKEVPDLVAMAKKHKDDLVIVGLTLDTGTLSKVEPFCARNGVKYPVYRPAREIVMRFGFQSIPYNVFYDRQGKMILAGSGMIDGETIEHVLRQVK